MHSTHELVIFEIDKRLLLSHWYCQRISFANWLGGVILAPFTIIKLFNLHSSIVRKSLGLPANLCALFRSELCGIRLSSQITTNIYLVSTVLVHSSALCINQWLILVIWTIVDSDTHRNSSGPAKHCWRQTRLQKAWVICQNCLNSRCNIQQQRSRAKMQALRKQLLWHRGAV